MPCSDCGYDLRAGQTDCPRCLYRLHVRQSPDPAPDAPDGAEPPSVALPLVAEVVPPRLRGLWVIAAVCLIAVALLLVRPLLRARHRTQAMNAQAEQAGAEFARADGPCRRGEEAPCRDSISALVALRDHSDASLLLGDFRVARYLQTQPGGSALEERWRQDKFSADELMAMGEEARRQNLPVYRSFWLYSNVKRDNVTLPTLTINNDPSPFGTR